VSAVAGPPDGSADCLTTSSSGIASASASAATVKKAGVAIRPVSI
jgi:hypothetical protein